MGESELGIHQAYLAAAGQTDAELPYSSIVALNEHGAVLHYMEFTRTPPEPAALAADRRRRQRQRLRQRHHPHLCG